MLPREEEDMTRPMQSSPSSPVPEEMTLKISPLCLCGCISSIVSGEGGAMRSCMRTRTIMAGIAILPLRWVRGSASYGELKNESGVHRLVRISPFNANAKRHTSFSMVEVIPKFKKGEITPLPEGEVRLEFARSGGAGGQNVNKRETAVRAVHIPTNLAVHVSVERSQLQNRERAIELLAAKVQHLRDSFTDAEKEKMYISKTTQVEWGNQIRSYVLHHYKMVKDHRTDVETSKVDDVLERGEIDDFIEAEKAL